MKQHVTILGALHIAHGILGLLVAFLILFILGGAGIVSQDPDAFAITSTIAVFAAFVVLVFSIPSLVGGVGLLKHKPWARILTLIIGCLKLLDIPIGTALGVYTIWVLTQQETVDIFTREKEKPAPAADYESAG